jgi:TPR repeat protein
MTSQKITIGLVAVALFVGSLTAYAVDFSEGVNAYQRGDYATALRIYRQLADQGDANAQCGLGLMYGFGKGVTQDYAAALKWYHKAAAQGYADAQLNLGLLYTRGRGVTQDIVQAHMWYTLAAASGDRSAGPLRDALATKMTPAQIAEAQKMAREWKPKKK